MAEHVGAMDPYRVIHKAIRNRLHCVAKAAGVTDFANADARAAFRTAFDGLVLFLAHHAAHEDTLIHSKLPPADKCPQLAEIEKQHAALEAELEDLTALVDVVIGSRKSGRSHELYLNLELFVAHHIEHMHLEETSLLPVMRETFSDADWNALVEADYGGGHPVGMAGMLGRMLDSLNTDDLAQVLGDCVSVHGKAPTEELLDALRPQLSGDAVAKLDPIVAGGRRAKVFTPRAEG